MSRRSWALDALVCLVVIALGLLEALAGVNATHRQGPLWAQAALYAVTGLLLIGRRRLPLWILTAIVVVSLAEFATFGSPEGMGVALAAGVAAYSVGRWEERPRAWWGLLLVTVLWGGWAGLDPMNDHFSDLGLTVIWLSPWVIAWLAGALVRSQLQNAEQRRLAREQRASRLVAEERNRIARELHDVIGHSVSVMTVQASAVRRRLLPDQSVERQALETVEAVGREALTEMRRMVGMLRNPGDPVDREPPPGLSELNGLVVKFRAAGLPVEIRVTGHPRQLSPGLDLTAYRLVQEGLTNTLRHAASPTKAVVSVSYRPETIEVSVRDDGGPLLGEVEAGDGLLGMRERVAVFEGRLLARPAPSGGFELMAILPLDGARDELSTT